MDEVLEDAILEYLAEHPKARDTWEGIVEWWLLEREVYQESQRVRQALQRLVDQGRLTMTQGPDKRVHYTVAGRPAGMRQRRRSDDG